MLQKFLRLLSVIALVFTASLGHTASKQVIVKSHEISLRIIEVEKVAPPYATFMWAVANDAGYRSLQGSQHPELSYFAAFTHVLALIKPSQARMAEGWLVTTNFTSAEKSAILAAHRVAQTLYNETVGELKQAEAANVEPWPSQVGLGIWRPTPPAHAQPLLPNWNRLHLFSKSSIPELTRGLKAPEVGSPQYNAELNRVYRLGGANSKERTAEQTQIAQFWVGGAGTVTPPGLWIDIAIKRLVQLPYGFKDSVHIMRTLSFALCDAGIASWSMKFDQKTWRPVSAIQEQLGDKTWTPLLATPPFPSYVSGHSTFSGAAATVLSVILPLESEPLRVTSPDMPGVVRSFKTYGDAAKEAGISRIYGGIHYDVDNIHGLILGQRVGCALLDTMYNYKCR